MISFLSGKILSIYKNSVVLMTPGGVGYEVALPTPLGFTQQVGSEANFFTYLKVSDSSLDLYGFASESERAFFELLMTVKGVGPKSALSIMSLGSTVRIQQAIARQDVAYLTSVQGLGKKTAERLVLELSGKLSTLDFGTGAEASENSVSTEAVDALVSLGYSVDEAKEMVRLVDGNGKSTTEILKLALQQTQ